MRAVEGGDGYTVVGDYDVKLMLSDQVSMNSNKFYKLQLLQDGSGNFFVATNWGRLGESGKSQLKGPHDEAKGIKEFEKVFRSKTKNAWGAPFQRFPDKYQLVEVEEGDDEGGDQALGRLSESQINKGQAVLKSIRKMLEQNGISNQHQKLGQLSNDFYSLIPTQSGRQKPPKLDNVEIVTEKEGLLEFWLRMGFEECVVFLFNPSAMLYPDVVHLSHLALLLFSLGSRHRTPADRQSTVSWTCPFRPH